MAKIYVAILEKDKFTFVDPEIFKDALTPPVKGWRKAVVGLINRTVYSGEVIEAPLVNRNTGDEVVLLVHELTDKGLKGLRNQRDTLVKHPQLAESAELGVEQMNLLIQINEAPKARR